MLLLCRINDQNFLEVNVNFMLFFSLFFLKQLLRVRTLTGNIYYTRSGAKIIGKVHEKFMLIDGIRVTTGSYRQVLGSISV